MADNSDSIEFEINNQLGIVGLEEDTPITQDSSTEVEMTRARGQMSQPRENEFQMLMDFIKQQFERQDEKSDKHRDEINAVSYTHLDVYKRQVKDDCNMRTF